MRHDYGRCDAILFTLHGTTPSVSSVNPTQAYERQLEKRPVPIQMTTSLLLASPGELLSRTHTHTHASSFASSLLYCSGGLATSSRRRWRRGDAIWTIEEWR